MSNTTDKDDKDTAPTPPTSSQTVPLADELTSVQFRTWWRNRLNRRHKAEGYPERAEIDHTPPAATISPSDLLGCHRWHYYSTRNAPSEEDTPHGTFEAGRRYEDIVESFIRSAAPSECLVENTVSIDFEVEVVGEGTGLSISGTTDPVVYTQRGDPLLLTEVKQTDGLSYIKDDGPYTRHRAQAHAYARGLQANSARSSPPPICYAYGSRDTLEFHPVFEQFDHAFWEETVIPWVIQNAESQAKDELPPPVDDDKQYMCQYCSFSNRCSHPDPGPRPTRVDNLVDDLSESGQPESPYASVTDIIGDVEFWWSEQNDPNVVNKAPPSPAKGFVPCHRYSESAVISHLATHESVRLTPTVAAQYPFLAAHTDQSPPDRLFAAYGVAPQRKVHDWVCPECQERYSYQQVEWDGALTNRPNCGSCRQLPSLRGPYPGELG